MVLKRPACIHRGRVKMVLKRPARSKLPKGSLSDRVLQQIANGQLVSKRNRLTGQRITNQLRNIRLSHGLGSEQWSEQAQASLRCWLLKKRKTDKRALPAPVVRVRPAAAVQESAPFARLNAWLRRAGCSVREGHIGMSGRAPLLKSLIPRVCGCIGQTGFNAGHSADMFLSARPSCKLVSFQLKHGPGTATRWTTEKAEEFIKNKYHGRHTIVFGNSQRTLVRFGHQHACIGSCFDVVFIDGGHSFKCAMADIVNFQPLARPSSIVIIDDVRRMARITRSGFL